MAVVGSSTEKLHNVGPSPIDDPDVQYKKPVRVPKQEMDRDTFLKLLVAQMKYQDPSSPMDMNAMMQQTASMTSVEKLTEMASIARSQVTMQQQIASASMLGKHVAYLDKDGAAATGLVDSMNFAEGKPLINVGGTLVPWDRVTALSNQAIDVASVPSSQGDTADEVVTDDGANTTDGTAPTDSGEGADAATE